MKAAIFLLMAMLFAAMLDSAQVARAGNIAANQSDPFFDCSKPQTPVQRNICGDAGYLDMDRNLAIHYGRLLKALPEGEKAQAIKEQNGWLQQREDKCIKKDPNVPAFINPLLQCLTEMFNKRYEDLYSEYIRAICRDPDQTIMNALQAIDRKDLPNEIESLIEISGGSSDLKIFKMDLNGDGIPEYFGCAHYFPHGPCAAVILGQIGSKWKVLSAGSFQGFIIPPEQFFIVLKKTSSGYHDICLPKEDNPIWKFVDGKYRPTAYPAKKKHN
jgi:uncharacterized protein YecT (DUF1311 family)